MLTGTGLNSEILVRSLIMETPLALRPVERHGTGSQRRRKSKRAASIDKDSGGENTRPPDLPNCRQIDRSVPVQFAIVRRRSCEITRTKASPSTKPERFAIASFASQ